MHGMFLTGSSSGCPVHTDDANPPLYFTTQSGLLVPDTLRSTWNKNVIGPLMQLLIVDFFERNRDVILAIASNRDFGDHFSEVFKLKAKAGESFEDRAVLTADCCWKRFINSMVVSDAPNNNSLTFLDFRDSMTSRQKEVFDLFSVFGSEDEPIEGIFQVSTTVLDNIVRISKRHPELELENPINLLNFLRGRGVLSVLKLIAAGGSGFADSLVDLNKDPEGEPWRTDDKKPVLVINSDGSIRPSPELISAARLIDYGVLA